MLTQFDTYTQLINGKDQEVQLASAKLEHQQAVGAQVWGEGGGGQWRDWV